MGFLERKKNCNNKNVIQKIEMLSVSDGFRWINTCVLGTGHENNIVQPKTVKWLSSPSNLSPFNCCLSVVL